MIPGFGRSEVVICRYHLPSILYHRLISMPSEHVMPLGFQPLGLGRELEAFGEDHT